MWHVIGGSVAGKYHQTYNTPCQDYHAFEVLPKDIVLIVLADGAGFAKYAQRGARLVVEHALQALKEGLADKLPENESDWEKLLREAFFKSWQILIAESENKQTILEDYSTTLSCVVATKNWLAAGQIGDGVIVVQKEDGTFFTVIYPQSGEHVNETFFVATDNYEALLDTKVFHTSVQAVVAMTDGLKRLAMNIRANTPHEPFFRPLLSFAAKTMDEKEAIMALVDFLNSERVCTRTDDDKTLILAVQKSHTKATELLAAPNEEKGGD